MLERTPPPPAPPAEAGPAKARRAVPFRGGGFGRKPFLWAGPLLFAALFVLWETGSRTGFISPIALPAPSEALGAFADLIETGMLWQHLQASLTRLVVGWTVGTFCGIAVGLAIGLFPLARAGLVPLVSALFRSPRSRSCRSSSSGSASARAPRSPLSCSAPSSPPSSPPMAGSTGWTRTLIRMGQSFGLPWRSIVRKIILPGALPAILSGARISASIAIILLVAAEMIGAEYGIGAYILMAGSLFALDQLIAGVAMLSVIGLLVAWLIGRVERRLLDYRL